MASHLHSAVGEILIYQDNKLESGRCSAAKLLTKDEARRIAANIAKLPEPRERAANRPCVGHHQKYESVCLLQRCYRIDGAFLPKCSGSSQSPQDRSTTR